eukprot:15475109-Alexandrium_andersonii.AAC.1
MGRTTGPSFSRQMCGEIDRRETDRRETDRRETDRRETVRRETEKPRGREAERSRDGQSGKHSNRKQ